MNLERISLENIYQNYLQEFKIAGKRPYPDRLLALLLLSEKDKYGALRVEDGEFYNVYKKEIETKINKVIADFKISKEEMIAYIRAKGVLYREEKYEYDKIWYVFGEGIACLSWAIMYCPDLTVEQVYFLNLHCFYGEDCSNSLEVEKKQNKILERKRG